MALTLYKKQKQIYDYLCQYIQRNEFAPTLREITYQRSDFFGDFFFWLFIAILLNHGK